MAQRDHVKRERTRSQNKGSNNKKKKAARSVSSMMLIIAIGILVVFASGLYYIKHSNKVAPPQTELQTKKNDKDTLPPKPEDRWRYIKELENRQAAMTPGLSSVENSTATSSLTAEQKKILNQVQTDMRPSNTNLPATYNQQVAPSTNNGVFIPPKVATKPVQTPSISPTAIPSTPDSWLLQCGSFKNQDQAESVRVKLAFAGISSRITTSGGWYRVILGPYANRQAVNVMLPRLEGAGVSGCITLAPK